MSSHEESTLSSAQHIYQAWDDALGAKDLDASMALYTPDATLESPLVRHLLGTERGVIEGKKALRPFVAEVFRRTPPLRRRYRSGYFTDGNKIIWEYPRATPDGDQMDLVEVMELQDGLIRHHRVYWGWLGVQVLKRGQH